MPSGSDFSCNNSECKYCGQGFAMHDFWPIVRIKDVLESKRAKDGQFKEDYIKGLNDKLAEGREYVCAPYPRQEDVKVCGIRVQLFCEDPVFIADQDIICDVQEGANLMNLASDYGIMTSCEPCKSKLLTFREAFSKGVKCPNCGTRMEGKIWYSTGG